VDPRAAPGIFTGAIAGDSAAIGLETARSAQAEGADDRELQQFFDELPGPIDHVIVTAGGSHPEPLADMDFARTLRFLDEHLMLPLQVARDAAGKIRPGGTLLLVDGAATPRPEAGLALNSAVTGATFDVDRGQQLLSRGLWR
jgi:hypothetical protein